MLDSAPKNITDALSAELGHTHLIEMEDLGDGYWSAATADDAATTMAPDVVNTYLVTPDSRVLMLPNGFPDSARLRLKGLLAELGDDVDMAWLLQESLQPGS